MACESLIGEQDRFYVADDAGETADATLPPLADGSANPGDDGGAEGDDASGADAADGAASALTYADRIRADRPLAYWRLGEAPGTAVAYADDGTGVVGTSPACPAPGGSVWNGCYGANLQLGKPGVIVGDGDTAVLYPGSAGDMRLAKPPSILGTPPLSLEIWARFRGLMFGNDQILLSYGVPKQNDAGGQYDSTELMELGVNALQVAATMQSLSLVVASAPSLNVWHHYVLTFNGRLLALYIDGQLAKSTSGDNLLGGFTADGGNFQVGGSETYAGNSPNGYLDEVAYYGVVLDAGTVAAHYAAALHGDAGTDAGADAGR